MTQFSPAPKPSAKKRRKPKAPTRSRVKRVNPERQARTHDKPYREWIAHRACLLTGRRECFTKPWRPVTEPAHVRTFGASRADRGNLVPLCPVHHDEQEGDTEGFEQTYGINLALEAAKLLVRYIEEGHS